MARRSKERRIRVRGALREDVDLDKLAYALLRFAEQLTPEERQRLRDGHGLADLDEAHDSATGDVS